MKKKYCGDNACENIHYHIIPQIIIPCQDAKTNKNTKRQNRGIQRI